MKSRRERSKQSTGLIMFRCFPFFHSFIHPFILYFCHFSASESAWPCWGLTHKSCIKILCSSSQKNTTTKLIIHGAKVYTQCICILCASFHFLLLLTGDAQCTMFIPLNVAKWKPIISMFNGKYIPCIGVESPFCLRALQFQCKFQIFHTLPPSKSYFKEAIWKYYTA